MQTFTTLLVALAFSACGHKPPPLAPEAPAPAPLAPIAPAPAPPPPAPTAPALTAEKPQPPRLTKAQQPKAAEAFSAFVELVGEARKLMRVSKHEEAMRMLEAALARVPGHPKALHELGRAAHGAGPRYFEVGYAATRQAIALAPDALKSIYYYDLGRMLEDKGEFGRAADAYRRSLAYKPDREATRKQLDGVRAKLGREPVRAGVSTLADACTSVFADWRCQLAAAAEPGVTGSCTCTNELLEPEEGFGRAALMRLSGVARDGGTVDATYLLLEVAAAWYVVALVGNDWHPGFGFVWNTSTRERFGFRELGGKKVLWTEYSNTSIDIDPTIYVERSDTTRVLTLCAVEGGAPRCWAVPLGTILHVSNMPLADGEIPPGEGPGKPASWISTLSADIVGADLVLTKTSGTLFPAAEGLPGTWSLATIGGAPGVVEP